MTGAARVREAFVVQGRASAALGSPFMGRLMALLAERLAPVGAAADAVLGWPGDPQPFADSVPLRLAGSLHALVLTGRDAALAAVYPPNDAGDDDALWRAVEAALARHAHFVLDWLRSPPQTNEVRRANGIFAALRLAAKLAGAQRLALLELGASAGLNLCCDRFAYRLGGVETGAPGSPVRLEPEWRGAPPQGADFAVVARAGCDINPLDVHAEGDLLRLRAYTWPDQRDRLERLENAAGIARWELARGAIMRADAGPWLEGALAARPADAMTAVFHTIAWQYFPQATARRCEAALAAAAQAATSANPLAWIGIENDGGDGAAIRLRLWPHGVDRPIGRMDFHGRWVEWRG